MGVDLRHRGRSAGLESRLRERVDLRAVEVVAEERVLVGGEVYPVGVRTKVWVVTKAGVLEGRRDRGRRAAEWRDASAAVVWGAVGAVVLDLNAVDGPRTGRVAAVANCQVE